jgi:hypothetical protein
MPTTLSSIFHPSKNTASKRLATMSQVQPQTYAVAAPQQQQQPTAPSKAFSVVVAILDFLVKILAVAGLWAIFGILLAILKELQHMSGNDFFWNIQWSDSRNVRVRVIPDSLNPIVVKSTN